MGNIYVGLSKLKNLYFGTTKVKKIYMGTEMVWQSAIPVAKPTQLSPSGTYSGSTITNGYTMPSGVTMTGSASGINAGTYTAVYTPDADHIWSDTEDRTPVTVTLTIARKSISGATVTLNATSKTYNGSAQSVSISSVTIGGLTATYSTSGTTSATNAGTYTVTATGTGNFSGTASASWTMNRATINTLTLNATSRTYNGSAQSVSVSTCKAGTLNATYSTSGTWSATAVGTYTATVTGTGNFTGSKSATWTISYSEAYVYYNGYMRSGASTTVLAKGSGGYANDTASITAGTNGHIITMHNEALSNTNSGSSVYGGITFPFTWLANYTSVTFSITVQSLTSHKVGNHPAQAPWLVNHLQISVCDDNKSNKSVNQVLRHFSASSQGVDITITNQTFSITVPKSQFTSGGTISCIYGDGNSSRQAGSYINSTVKINSIILS